MENQAGTKSISGKSVAAFFLLPQFWRSFEHFDHIGPIFVRTLAIMFEQAGLIAKNHPATMYGAPGIKKTSIRALLGEAWFTLRSTPNATPYQWGLFASVIAMIVSSIAALLSAAVNFYLSHAQAQFFTHPSGIATDMASAGTGTTNALYNTGQTSPDVALDLLNKVLRQPALNGGGALQKALGPLLNTYSTAVMIIASFVVFWSIMAIVIDTAKTGHFGGGHNMVWTPIRFVFAMGLMIPTGAGFNTGQIIIMKLAEWGSNLGSNGWYTYVNAVADGSLLTDPTLGYLTNEMMAYAKIHTCMTAFNIYFQQATGTNPIGNVNAVNMKQYTPGFLDSNDLEIYTYTNAATKALCGSVQVPDPKLGRQSYYTAAKLALTSLISTKAEGDAFQSAVRQAHKDAFFAQELRAQQMACDFNRHHFTGVWADAVAPNVPSAMCVGGYSLPVGGGALGGALSSTGTGPCDGTGAGGSYPSERCIVEMATNYRTAVDGATAQAMAALRSGISAANGSFLTQVKRAGWAGMGVWYHKISSLNVSINQVSSSGIMVLPPNSVITVDTDMPRTGNTVLNNPEQLVRVSEVLTDYDRWWQLRMDNPTSVPLSNPVLAGARRSFSTASIGTPNAGGGGGLGGDLGSLLNKLFGDGKGLFLVDIQTAGVGNTPVYPMAELARIGNGLLNKSLVAYGLLASTSLLAMIPWIGNGISSLLSGPVGGLVATIASAGLGAGAVLLYFLPILPWIRVTFSVISWIVAIFEAVVTVPIVALGHLNTKGEGLMGGMKAAYVLWLNILLRPILTVIGYVGAILIFNGMFVFINETIAAAVYATTGGESLGIITQAAYTIIYVGVIYTVLNTTFKLVDIIPNSTMKWMQAGQEHNFEDSASEGFILAGSSMLGQMGNSMMRTSPKAPKSGDSGGGGAGVQESKVNPADYNRPAPGPNKS